MYLDLVRVPVVGYQVLLGYHNAIPYSELGRLTQNTPATPGTTPPNHIGMMSHHPQRWPSHQPVAYTVVSVMNSILEQGVL